MLGGDITLRSKRELIEKFIEENLPHIHDADKIEDEFEQYWQDRKSTSVAQTLRRRELRRKTIQCINRKLYLQWSRAYTRRCF